MYGVFIRFYANVIQFKIICDLKEDLIELITSATLSGDLSLLVLELFRV